MTKTSRRAGLALLSILFISVLGCSDDDDPVAPVDAGPDAVATIGPAGGAVSADQTAVLHVPAAAFAQPVEIAQHWLTDTPAAPVGWVQVGPSVRWGAGGQVPDVPLQVALHPEFDIINNPGGLSYCLARMVRLNAAGEWDAVADGHGLLGLALSAAVDDLGTFAVHVADPLAPSDLPRAAVTMTVSHRMQTAGQAWSSSARFEIFAGGSQENLIDAGGAVLLDGQELQIYNGAFFRYWDRPVFEPGLKYVLDVPGSDTMPPLDLQITYLDHGPKLTTPAAGEVVDPTAPFSITWAGAGGGLIWLIVHGDGPEGFDYIGQMTPDDGEFTLSTADLARFNLGTEVHVFLQLNGVTSLDVAGYGVGSQIYLENSSSSRFRLGES